MTLLDLWPALVLIFAPPALGTAVAVAVDAWSVLRDLRAGRTVDR